MSIVTAAQPGRTRTSTASGHYWRHGSNGRLHVMTAVFAFGVEDDLHVFPSEEYAAGWMEAVDVEEGEYAAAYLLDGTVLEFWAAEEEVFLRRTDSEDLPALMARLRASQRAAGGPEEVGDLVAFANEVMREEWEGRWPRPPRWLRRWFPGKGPPRVEQT